MPIICHRNFQIVSNTTQLTTYLICQFPMQMRAKLFKEEYKTQMAEYFEWSANNLRPCIKLVLRFSMMMKATGVEPRNQKDDEKYDATPSAKSTSDLSAIGTPNQMTDGRDLQHMYDSYLSKFKVICEQMER